jgi:hypothetical protein
LVPVVDSVTVLAADEASVLTVPEQRLVPTHPPSTTRRMSPLSRMLSGKQYSFNTVIRTANANTFHSALAALDGDNEESKDTAATETASPSAAKSDEAQS